MNLRQIYDQLKRKSEISGQNIDDAKLKQQAWVLRDKMMFEANFSNTSWCRLQFFRKGCK